MSEEQCAGVAATCGYSGSRGEQLNHRGMAGGERVRARVGGASCSK